MNQEGSSFAEVDVRPPSTKWSRRSVTRHSSASRKHFSLTPGPDRPPTARAISEAGIAQAGSGVLEARREGSRGWSNAEPPDPVPPRVPRPGGGARSLRTWNTRSKASAAPPGRDVFRFPETGRSAPLHTRLPSFRASGTPDPPMFTPKLVAFRHGQSPPWCFRSAP